MIAAWLLAAVVVATATAPAIANAFATAASTGAPPLPNPAGNDGDHVHPPAPVRPHPRSSLPERRGRRASSDSGEIYNTTVQIATRDGVSLNTYLFLPSPTPASKLPVIIERTPYGAAGFAGAAAGWIGGGYAVMFQDFRGRFGSTGEFSFWRTEADDMQVHRGAERCGALWCRGVRPVVASEQEATAKKGALMCFCLQLSLRLGCGCCVLVVVVVVLLLVVVVVVLLLLLLLVVVVVVVVVRRNRDK